MQPAHYRNKVHAVFAFQKGRGIISGIYQEKSHRVVPVESCLLENQKAGEIIRSVRELAKSFKLKAYDEDSGYGLLRHVLVRVGHITGEIMVVLVLGSPILPSKKNFVNELCKLHPEITTILINVNNMRTSMVLGEKEQVIYGKGYIEDELCGMIQDIREVLLSGQFRADRGAIREGGGVRAAYGKRDGGGRLLRHRHHCPCGGGA